MANLVYKRVSTDQQSTDRQNLVLAEAGIEDPVAFEEAAGTSSRLHPLQRPKFAELLVYARPGDTVHISEMFRLVRGTGHILDVLDVLHRDRLALRIHDGAFSAMDLTARHPRTGELLSTVKFMVQTLAAVADLLPEYTAADPDTSTPELPVVLDMPGKVADFLRATELEPAERTTLDQGVTVRRGQGYTLRVTAVPAIHRRLLDLRQALDGTAAVPAQRKARREYENRVNLHAPATNLGSQSRSAT
ncbi:recombinase family protein [Nocardia sp. NBC_00416]|uniref:recombinase family protein n=1 Tax=Nocardia sp. NBC_00416 TaxID=2975991 RepID=UPI002E2256E9